MSPNQSGFRYSAPDDLGATKTGLRNVLVIGSCLISGLPRYIREHEAGCESDYILFNNGSELPPVPPRPIAEYDLQMVQIGTRSILQERDYFWLKYDDLAGYQAMFERVAANLSRTLNALLQYNIQHGLLTLVVNFFVPQQNAMGRLLPRYDLRNTVYFFEALNKVLNDEVAKYQNVHILDVELLARQLGKKFIQDDAVWSLAHNAALSDFDFEYDQHRLQPLQKMSEIYESRVHGFVQSMWAEAVAIYRTVRQIDTVKLVVVDLDDTLWRGVLAEEQSIPWTAIEGWPLGFVEALLYLKRRGVMLAIVSKNEVKTVERIWRELFRGMLALEDFVVRKINWQSKAENFAEVLQEVNILARNAVYIDDNPIEREVIHDAFPEVRLLGANPYLLKRILLWAPETQVPAITAESARRTEMVQQQVLRENERSGMSRAEFLQSLALRIRPSVIKSENDPGFARAFELVNKTNQYNTTGQRWKLEEIRNAMAEGLSFHAFEVEDRFSRYGQVAVAIAQAGTIRQFVMSCRVVGLGVEMAALALVAKEIFRAGHGSIQAGIVETDANFVVRDVFEKLGFVQQGGIWVGTPEQVSGLPDHISVEG